MGRCELQGFITMKKNEDKPQESQPNNPLHGVKLATILDFLVEEYGCKGRATLFKEHLAEGYQRRTNRILYSICPFQYLIIYPFTFSNTLSSVWVAVLP